MTGVRVAREMFRWKIELQGYDTMELLGLWDRTFPPLIKTGAQLPNALLIGRGPVALRRLHVSGRYGAAGTMSFSRSAI
jgi:hypothetical protein